MYLSGGGGGNSNILVYTCVNIMFQKCLQTNLAFFKKISVNKDFVLFHIKFEPLRGTAPPILKLACFVLYLKTINIILKNNICI